MVPVVQWPFYPVFHRVATEVGAKKSSNKLIVHVLQTLHKMGTISSTQGKKKKKRRGTEPQTLGFCWSLFQ